MLAVTARQGQIELIEKDVPDGGGELIKVTSAGICRSDLHLISAGLSHVVLGHEFGGYTTDGRLVAVRPTGECGTCASCQALASSTCAEATSRAHGIAIDGGLAEFVRVEPSRLFEVPSTINASHVGLVEPLAVVIHGINRLEPERGSRAVVVGAGSIGLLAAAALQHRGVNVDLVARHPHQFAVAESLGIHAIDLPANDYDYSFDAVCSQQSFNQCIAATRPRGTLLEFGMVWSPVALSNQFLMKEISIVPSIYYSHDHKHHDFEEAIQLLATNNNIASAIVTHRFHLTEAQKAFEVASNRKAGAVKVQFNFE